MPLIPFPNVPNVPGVPPLLRSSTAPILNSVVLLTADVLTIAGMFQGPQWGIFNQNGNAVIVGDSVVALDFKRDFRVSDYPLEQGSFANYNKVATPADARLVFTKGGTEAERTTFLQSVDAACASLNLFTVVTPEVFYDRMNVDHYDYRRESRNGVTLLTVSVWLIEVRLTSPGQFSNSKPPPKPKEPQSTDSVNDGTVQPTETPPAITSDMLQSST